MWMEFGLAVGLDSNMLKAWEAQYRGDATRCWLELMKWWLNGNGNDNYPVTWEGVYSLLKDAHYENIAHKLQRAVGDVPIVRPVVPPPKQIVLKKEGILFHLNRYNTLALWSFLTPFIVIVGSIIAILVLFIMTYNPLIFKF